MDIKQLVERYEAERDNFLKPEYNETQLRNDFLNPFFQLLGWDIENQGGRPTSDREVLLEESVRYDATENPKKPDYTFRLFSERKFFLEAKKPSVKIESDDNSAKQVRRYGFTGNLKISVLSNFEHLAIYDCTQRVDKDDTVSKCLIQLYHYKEFNEKFDEIKEKIGRKAVYSGEFDKTWKCIESKISRSSVDTLFLNQINKWRKTLASEIYKESPEINNDDLNDLVQSYLNSIIFLRVCEDRNLETYKTLLTHAKKSDFKSLKKQFRKADKKYNAGLFKKQLTGFVISNDSSAFWDIINELYYPESTYSFSVFSSDILGSIYETFIGHELVIKENKIEIEKKPENINRDIVTTPIFIIREILKQTVNQHCEGKSDKEILRSKFADIACGSGSFLLETFQLLQDILLDYYIEHDSSKLIQTSFGGAKLPFEIKREILENCIFGVDKDHSAVEACKFGLLLKLLENEDNNTISEPALPDLEKNISWGNSLITSDMSEDLNLNPYDFPETFDVIVGNPPYMKTADMLNFTPKEVPLYKKNYKSGVSQFDKYFLFIERSLQLLNKNGYSGHIIPSKFMKLKAGKDLRRLLTHEKSVREITLFGANQIFRDKTTYTSILILSNTENSTFKKIDVKDVDGWKARNSSSVVYEILDAEKISSEPWVFVPPELTKAYGKILNISTKLEDIVGENNIINGIQTSANDIFIIEPEGEDEEFVYFKKNNDKYKIEKGITKPYFRTPKNDDIPVITHKTLIANSKVIFPYRRIEGKMSLIPIEELKKSFQHAYSYLLANKEGLDKRSISPKPKSKNEWYRYGRHQCLEMDSIERKIVVGINSNRPKYPIDTSNTIYSSGGTAGYCSIHLSDKSKYSIYYIQAILNSCYLEMIVNLTGEEFKGGYVSRGTKLLPTLPIRTIDFGNKSDKEFHEKIVKLQKKLILNRDTAPECSDRERLKLNRQYKSLMVKMENILKELYNLEDDEGVRLAIRELTHTGKDDYQS